MLGRRRVEQFRGDELGELGGLLDAVTQRGPVAGVEVSECSGRVVAGAFIDEASEKWPWFRRDLGDREPAFEVE